MPQPYAALEARAPPCKVSQAPKAELSGERSPGRPVEKDRLGVAAAEDHKREADIQTLVFLH